MVLIPIGILDGFSCYISIGYEHVILVLGIVDGILFQRENKTIGKKILGTIGIWRMILLVMGWERNKLLLGSGLGEKYCEWQY